MYRTPAYHQSIHQQRGATLLELMVGMTIGLLTIGTAIATLGISRNVTTTVSDVTHMQQQASYAFRILGQQLRQAGSIRLALATNKIAGQAIDAIDPVAFDTSFVSTNQAITGLDNAGTGQYSLTLAKQDYTEPSFTSPGSEVSFFRDCLGESPVGTSNVILNQFALRNGSLVCAGVNNIPQPLIQNVNDFQIRYLAQSNIPNSANPTIQRITAAQASADWTRVYGVEVCLDLVGDLTVDTPAGSTYRDCNDNLTSYGTPPRLHMVFRNVYQIRGQGLAGY